MPRRSKAVNRRPPTKLLLSLIIVASGLVAVGVAVATPSQGSLGIVLSRGLNPDDVKVHTDGIKYKTQGPTDILTLTQTWQPGGHSGWHLHSGLVLFTLRSGEVSVLDENCAATKVSAGEAFVEPVGEPMEVKNYGSTPAVAYVTIVNAPGAPGRNDAAEPGCDFR